MRICRFTALTVSLFLCQSALALAANYYDPYTYSPDANQKQYTPPQQYVPSQQYAPQKQYLTKTSPNPSGAAYPAAYENIQLRPGLYPENTPKPISLGTESAFDAGVQFARYLYGEPNVGNPGDTVDVSIRGLKYGAEARGTVAVDEWFMRAEGRFAFGDDDYKGSGKIDGVADDLAEARFLVGHDFLTNALGLSPYVGAAFRDLFNDGRGISTTGAHGYRRESRYLYVPVGLTTRARIDDDSRMSLNTEYDQLVWGRQYSHLEDASPVYSTLINTQIWGYGLRGDLMYEHRRWGIGPFFDYWNIDQSRTACGSTIYGDYIYTTCGDEPHNFTLEYGIQFRYKLF
jgi:hypothetical protein